MKNDLRQRLNESMPYLMMANSCSQAIVSTARGKRAFRFEPRNLGEEDSVWVAESSRRFEV